MNSQLQTLAALLIVAACAVGLVVRALRKRANPGCGGDCACPAKIQVPKKSRS